MRVIGPGEALKEDAMGWRNIGWVLLGTLLIGTAERPAWAGWGEGLFAESGHNFGPVPRGAKVRYNFILTNRLGEPVTIVDVRASCGCTTGKASASTVPVGGSAVIEAEMDTRNFVGVKRTQLILTLMTAQGQETEVRLAVESNILSDIVLNPGTIDFGTVSRGKNPSATLTIERVGAPDWRALRMVSPSKALTATLQEVSRGGGMVRYQLSVALRPDAPAGSLRDEIQVVTNDRESPTIPIQVTAQIQGDLTATPAVLALGEATSAEGVKGRYLIRGAKPFAITRIDGSGDGFLLSTDNLDRKPIHILTLNYKLEQGTSQGDLRRTFRVTTDQAGEPPLELTATLRSIK